MLAKQVLVVVIQAMVEAVRVMVVKMAVKV